MERDKRRKRVKRIVLVVVGSILALLIFAAVGIAGYAYYVSSVMHETVFDKKSAGALLLTPTKPMQPYNVLILGVDQRPGETQFRSDSMIVAHIDPQSKHVWLLSIPRDTRVDIPGHGVEKINGAHFFGGPALTVKTVEQFTGLDINHYIEVNFTGFKRAVDTMGGVWVNVPVAINDVQADRSPGHRAAKVPAGWQLLDGEHALTFVRARHQFVDQDFTRMKDQQLFFKAFADQMAKTSSVAKVPSMINSVVRYVHTDMGLMDLMTTGLALRQMGGANVYTATVTGEWKTPYVWPDETRLAQLVGDIKAGRSFTGTKTVTPPVAGSAGKVVVVKTPAQVSVTIKNGAGVAGLAAQAASALKAKGFKVPTTGNASQSTYKQTLVIYKTDASLAQLVASYLPPGTKVVQGGGKYSFKTDVLVVLGKDWDASRVPAVPITTH